MMNSEIATSVMLGVKLTIVVLDNRGFGCINRLQRATGGESFNNLLQRHAARDAARHRLRRPCREPRRDRREGDGHRRAGGGAEGRRAATTAPRSIVIDTDPAGTRPMPAAIGGMSRCPKSSRRSGAMKYVKAATPAPMSEALEPLPARRSTDRAQICKEKHHAHPHRGKPHRLVERRHAGARRRDAAGDLPRARPRKSASRAWSSATSSRARPTR